MKGIDASEIDLNYNSEILQRVQETREGATLYDVYLHYVWIAQYVQDSLEISSAYFQYMDEGVTYTLVDPQYGPFGVGMIEEPLDEFASYGDNERIPPTVYESIYGWLCTGAMPIVDSTTGNVVAMFCFDIDMNEVQQERRGYLLSGALYVLMATAIGTAASLFFVRRIVTRPIIKLTGATRSICEDDLRNVETSVMDLDIHSDDEIGELYREFRAMQGRIRDYAQHIALISAKEEREKTEIEFATNIQEAMLPGVFPAFPDRREFDIYASMEPAIDVGGDFYDFFFIDENHLAVVIADVSGKGVPAALFMMAAMIMIEDRGVMGGTPSEILGLVNAKICDNNQTKMFVTAWLGILDIRTGQLICSNAGH